MLPALPSWDGLHPIIIHFPIALLLIAPVLIVMSLVIRPHARPFAYAALLLMFIGAAALYLATATGEAAGEMAERDGAVEQVLEHHETLAEQTKVVFSVITAVYAFIVLAPLVAKKAQKIVPWTAVNGAFLVFYLAGAILLVNTGHEGGRLVHEFGVRALVSSPASSAATSQGEVEDDDGDGDGDDDDDDR